MIEEKSGEGRGKKTQTRGKAKVQVGEYHCKGLRVCHSSDEQPGFVLGQVKREREGTYGHSVLWVGRGK